MARGETETESLGGAKALYDQLVAPGRNRLEESFFDLVLGRCEQKWPEENWKDRSSMAKVVDAMENRVMMWPEKWKARYVAEGRAQVHARIRQVMLASLEKAVPARFGESAAQASDSSFRQLERPALLRISNSSRPSFNATS